MRLCERLCLCEHFFRTKQTDSAPVERSRLGGGGSATGCTLAIATCAEVALVIVPLLILLGNAACRLFACVVAIDGGIMPVSATCCAVAERVFLAGVWRCLWTSRPRCD